MYRIKFVDISPAGIQACRELLTITFPHAAQDFSPLYVRWLYVDNPGRPIVGFNAFESDRLVAHYVTIPIRASLFGVEKQGLLSLNTATHPDYQGQKLFSTLATRTYEYGTQNGYEFVIGVANANSTPGLRRLGFQLVCPLEAKVGFGYIPFEEATEAVDFQRIWDTGSLHWRLSDPRRPYRLTESRAGYMMVLAPVLRSCASVVLTEAEERVLRDTPLQVMEWGNVVPKVWIGVDCSINWQRNLTFIDIPRFLRPSPLNLIFKDLTGQERCLDSGKVKFHDIDFDAF